ncbi:endonuclease/exonuclease/phosphatase family protein [Actinosynnema sp. NPDC047251]|uniref:Endonuclease/exonuclease/phosphatase n=1 Tax=Saccharothrix espanaensis (strain ATCC 51144 / DSM 44229 / JCM 9112 / NBRC 15066 / NRRL 15764) TaxID=1179773 RepID=K0JSA3_SACES|nr:endonuclease/exonuclease/phosphatase family protein [Saccharothrix espanaensis]CCH27704.1 Endonuclease/exonuclease/phosphatase [Saccharothrix espanaensis DSM 44229]
MADLEVRRPRRKVVTFLLVLATVAFCAAAGLRLLGIDGTRHMVALTALTPYSTAAGVLLGAVALLVRRWALGTVTLLLSLVLVSAVAPRAFPDARPIGVGQDVRVMSVNLEYGRADAAAVVAAARANQVDVLALQELTPGAVDALDRAGLADVLPHRVFLPDSGAAGSGLAARRPLSSRASAPSTFRQARALVDLPGEDLELVSVHTLAPTVPGGTEPWQRDLAGLPKRDLNGPMRVLVGDFNATMDHVGLRRLLNQGYVDAADQVGEGLNPTWPSRGYWPPVVLDHVLVDNRCPVDAFRVLDLPGTDHRGILTRFVVPAS